MPASFQKNGIALCSPAEGFSTTAIMKNSFIGSNNLFTGKYTVGQDAGNDMVIQPYTYNGIDGYRVTKTQHSGWGSFVAFLIDYDSLDITKKYSFSIIAVNLSATAANLQLFVSNSNSTNVFIDKSDKLMPNTLKTIYFRNITPNQTYPSAHYSSYGWHMNVSGTKDFFIANPIFAEGADAALTNNGIIQSNPIECNSIYEI